MAFVVECRPLNGRQLFFLALISIFMVVSIVQTPKAKLEKKVQESRILTMTFCVPVFVFTNRAARDRVRVQIELALINSNSSSSSSLKTLRLLARERLVSSII